jgi:peptide subunit release factor 1 (eRF1)
MISKSDIQRLLARTEGNSPIFSLCLDMSVNSENKRTYQIFLNQCKRDYAELASDRATHHREAIGAAFARAEQWLADVFDESNKGVAFYTDLEGSWQDALQLPIPLPNRLVVGERPLIGPLAQVIERHRRHGVLLVDRQHLRMLGVYLGRAVQEREVDKEPYPVPHDVQRGGYSQANVQRRKAEEVRHFFKEFAQDVADFDRQQQASDLVVLGTDENVKQFLDYLSPPLREKVVHTGHLPEAGMSTPAAEVISHLDPFFATQMESAEAEAVKTLRERVEREHLASAGFANTLEQLQEGKVESLVLARDAQWAGSRCLACGFYLATRDQPSCPYCGGETRDGVDVVELMIRMAEEQSVPIEFVSNDTMQPLDGVGALLRF